MYDLELVKVCFERNWTKEFCSLKDTGEEKDKPQNKRKYLQIAYLVKVAIKIIKILKTQ